MLLQRVWQALPCRYVSTDSRCGVSFPRPLVHKKNSGVWKRGGVPISVTKLHAVSEWDTEPPLRMHSVYFWVGIRPTRSIPDVNARLEVPLWAVTISPAQLRSLLPELFSCRIHHLPTDGPRWSLLLCHVQPGLPGGQVVGPVLLQ